MTLWEKQIKSGAKVTWHSKCVFLQLAEIAVTRNLFAAILGAVRQDIRDFPREFSPLGRLLSSLSLSFTPKCFR